MGYVLTNLSPDDRAIVAQLRRDYDNADEETRSRLTLINREALDRLYSERHQLEAAMRANARAIAMREAFTDGDYLDTERV